MDGLCKNLVTEAVMAKYLSVSPRTLRRMAADERIKGRIKIRGWIRYNLPIVLESLKGEIK